MSAEQILMGMRKGEGCDDDFPGLIPLVRSYLQKVGADAATNRLVDRYVFLRVSHNPIFFFIGCWPLPQDPSVITLPLSLFLLFDLKIF